MQFARNPNDGPQNDRHNNVRYRNNNSPLGISSSAASPTVAWFQGAPLSKFITMVTVAAHVVCETGGFGGSSMVSLDWQAVLFEGQVYRLFLYPLAFSSIGELVLGLAVLCPLMRRFEREMGTRNFASFLFFQTLPLATIIQCLLLELSDLSPSDTNDPSTLLAPGPYPHIGSLLYLYHRYTPRQHPRLFGILGLDFSDKAFTYGFAIQTSIAGGWPTILPFAVGFLSGWIVQSVPKLGLDPTSDSVISLPPGFIMTLAEWVGRPLGLDALRYSPSLGVVSPMGGGGVRRRPRMDGTRIGGGVGGGPMGAGMAMGAGGPPQPPRPDRFEVPPPSEPPSEEKIGQLTAMGFDRDAVVRALRATDNNAEAAANRLLSGS